MTLSRPTWLGLLLAADVLLLDQLSKWALIEHAGMASRPPIEVTPFFNLVMVWNKGVSFGMFSSLNQPLFFVALSTVIVAILLVWLGKTASPLVCGALGMVIGGAVGNTIDRLRYGAVADFFEFHLGPYSWPAFNIADSAIFIGVVLLCLDGMFSGRPKNKGTNS